MALYVGCFFSVIRGVFCCLLSHFCESHGSSCARSLQSSIVATPDCLTGPADYARNHHNSAFKDARSMLVIYTYYHNSEN